MKFSQCLVLLICLMIPNYVMAICWSESDGTFLPDPDSRTDFFYCRLGSAIRASCPQGMEFDPFLRICDTVVQTLPPVTSNPCQGVPDGTFLPDPSSRQRFFYCNGGEAIPGQCDPGKEFFPNESICDRAQNPPNPPPTQPPRGPCFNRPDGIFLPDPSSRQRFFFCSGGEALPGECPQGQEFFPDESICDNPRIQTPEPPPIPRDPCFGQIDGTFVQNPESREGFFWCSGGIGTPGICPDGKIFEPLLQICDFDDVTTRPPPLPTTRAPPPVPTRPPPAVPTRAPPGAPTKAPPAVPTRVPPGVPTRAPPAVPTRAPPGGPTRAPPGGPTRAPPGGPTRAPPVVPTRAPPGFKETKAPSRQTRPTRAS